MSQTISTQKLNSLAELYLKPLGWFNNSPTTNSGRTLPWYTYPTSAYLDGVVTKDHKVFEYGAGYSTVYFSNLAHEVYSVDHDREWVGAINTKGTNVTLQLKEEGHISHQDADSYYEQFKTLNWELPTCGDRATDIRHGMLSEEFRGYASTIFEKPAGYFDVVVVDGMARSLCGYYASLMVAENGIIILDNSDRWQYNSLQQYLTDVGFGRIDFWGVGPLNVLPWCTSVFSKQFKIPVTNVKRNAPAPDLGW